MALEHLAGGELLDSLPKLKDYSELQAAKLFGQVWLGGAGERGRLGLASALAAALQCCEARASSPT